MKTKKSLYILIFLLILIVILAATKCIRTQGSICNPRPIVEHLQTYHNSRNALDWAGIYAGVIPCADCAGIEVKIMLNLDETFQIFWHYLSERDNTFTASGTFAWNGEGSKIEFLELYNFPRHFQVGEGRLFMLDQEGQRIYSNLSEHYILSKIDN